MRSKVAVTVNVQGIGPDLISIPEEKTLGRFSHGRYAYRAGIARLLDRLRHNKVKATFFWPSSEAKRVPGLLHRCLEEGHEVASHGRAFENLQTLDWKTEETLLREAHLTLTSMCGSAPVGFRSPSSISASTFKILSDLGYRYDSSNLDDDAPYSLTKDLSLGPSFPKIVGAKNMVELPYTYGLVDSYHLLKYTALPRCQTMMLDVLGGLLSHGQHYACLTFTPRGDTGLCRAVHMPVVDALLQRARTYGAQFELCKDMAAPLLNANGAVVWNGKERA